MAEKEIPAWQRALVARAQGREADPADLEAAREASRPGTVGWAVRVAQRATGRPAAPEDGGDGSTAA